MREGWGAGGKRIAGKGAARHFSPVAQVISKTAFTPALSHLQSERGTQPARLDAATGQVVRDYNPTTHGAFNDENMPFWNDAFWKPSEVQFRPPKTDCEDLFDHRLGAAIEKAMVR